MTTITLPPLPEPVGKVLYSGPYHHTRQTEGAFDADQLRTYGLAVAKAVLEGAANACDTASTLHRDQYKGRAPYPNPAVKAYDPYVDGLSDGAGECADTVRNLEVKHHE
jgi:hypothetical protein